MTSSKKEDDMSNDKTDVNDKPTLTDAQQAAIEETLDSWGLVDDERRIGQFMLAALVVGADVDRVASATGIDREFIQPFAARLEENGIWRNKEAVATGDGTEFLLQILAAQGLVECTDSPQPPRPPSR